MSKMVIYAAIISFLFGLITAQIAKLKGRNPVGWFCLGTIFSFLGLIAVLTLKELPFSERRD